MSAGRLTLAFSLLLAIAWAAPAAAAPGDLDPTFGTYGKFLEPISENTTADSVVVTADGRIIVGGGSSKGATVYGFTADGKPDPSFGDNGRVALPSTYGNASIALQGDKVVVAASDNKGYGNLMVFRLTPDGALDPSFGVDGVAATGQPSGRPGPQIAVAPDQKIVVASTSAPIAGLVIARLLPDGDGFDPSFGGGVVYETGATGISAQAVAAGPGNEVTVLSGAYATGSKVLRFAADGTRDSAFGEGGEASVNPGGPALLYDIALRPDGSSVVVGYNRSSYHGVVAALTPSGRPDKSFGSGGSVELQDTGSAIAFYGVRLDGSGRILLTGVGSGGVELARLQPDGSFDSTFGANGEASARFDRAQVEGVSLAFAPDGRIVVATERITGFRSDHLVMGLMRFLVDGGPGDPDGDGVIGKRDRCPDLGGTRRHRGCPFIERSLKLGLGAQGVKGAVRTNSRHCRAIDRASIYSAQPGRDELLQRVTINNRGLFRARLGQKFQGRVYARLRAHINPVAGLCGPARSDTVKVG